jgi:hypothetical protein
VFLTKVVPDKVVGGSKTANDHLYNEDVEDLILHENF